MTVIYILYYIYILQIYILFFLVYYIPTRGPPPTSCSFSSDLPFLPDPLLLSFSSEKKKKITVPRYINKTWNNKLPKD